MIKLTEDDIRVYPPTGHLEISIPKGKSSGEIKQQILKNQRIKEIAERTLEIINREISCGRKDTSSKELKLTLETICKGE